MKAIVSLILIIIIAALCIGCGSVQNAATAESEPTQSPETVKTEEAPASEQTQSSRAENEEAGTMQMKIGETDVKVVWEDNESVAALKELARDGLHIEMSMYGGFEQVGSIGQSLPREDSQTTTLSGRNISPRKRRS